MNIGRFLGFVLAGGLWEAFGRERAAPLIERGASRLVDIGEEVIEGYKGGRAGTLVGSSAKRATATAKPTPKRPTKAPAAAPKPKGRPPSQATVEKRKKEAQLAALARGRETRRKNLAAKQKQGPISMPQVKRPDMDPKASK